MAALCLLKDICGDANSNLSIFCICLMEKILSGDVCSMIPFKETGFFVIGDLGLHLKAAYDYSSCGRKSSVPKSK